MNPPYVGILQQLPYMYMETASTWKLMLFKFADLWLPLPNNIIKAAGILRLLTYIPLSVPCRYLEAAVHTMKCAGI
jgi:hypothetical protein